MNIWVAIVPAMAASAVTMFLLSRRGHGRSTFRPDLGTVELALPKAQVTTIRIIAGCAPFLIPVLVLLSPQRFNLSGALVCELAFLFFAGIFVWVAAGMARRIIVSARGIQVVGYRGWQQPWSALASIDVVSPGADAAVFRFQTGQKIAVDGTFDGWLDLMKHLRSFTANDAAALAKVNAAIRELYRWRVGAARY